MFCASDCRLRMKQLGLGLGLGVRGHGHGLWAWERMKQWMDLVGVVAIVQDPGRTKSQSCDRQPYLTLESPRRIRLLQQFYLAPLQRKLLRGDIYNEGLSLIANAQEPSCSGILTGASLSDCAECAWSALLSQCVMTCDFREPSFSYMTEPIIELAE